MWSGETLTRQQLTSKPDYLWPKLWEKMGKMPNWRRGKSGHMKNLDSNNARKLRGIYFIDPEDKEFKEAIKNARKKLETLVAPVMLCKISKNNQNWVTRGKSNEIKSNLRVFWKPVNLQDCVWENHYRIIMKTTLQEEETIHYIIIWFTNLFLCLKPWKFLQQRQQWIRDVKNWRKFRRGTWRKSEVRKRW